MEASQAVQLPQMSKNYQFYRQFMFIAILLKIKPTKIQQLTIFTPFDAKIAKVPFWSTILFYAFKQILDT